MRSRVLTTQEFIEKAKIIHPNYDLSLVEYTGCHGKIKIICPTHGFFEIIPTNLLHGQGCPNCKMSKGEEFVKKWLQDNNMKYTQQKRFTTCKDKQQLPFDFYINETKILIEYDGIQHFKSVKWFGGEKELKNVIRRDNIKNEWAKNNGYIVIRINYKMNNEERIRILESLNSDFGLTIKQKGIL